MFGESIGVEGVMGLLFLVALVIRMLGILVHDSYIEYKYGTAQEFRDMNRNIVIILFWVVIIAALYVTYKMGLWTPEQVQNYVDSFKG